MRCLNDRVVQGRGQLTEGPQDTYLAACRQKNDVLLVFVCLCSVFVGCCFGN